MIFNNLKLIFSESYKWRNRDLLVSKDFVDPILNINVLIKNNTIIVLLGMLFAVFFNKLINNEFAANMVTALSVFVGLFTTTLILIFDKYITYHKIEEVKGDNPIDLGSVPSDLDTNLLRTKNFSKKFVFVSLESLLIAVICIILLMFPMMIGESFIRDFRDYNFEFRSIDFIKIKLFIVNSLILLIRVLLFISGDMCKRLSPEIHKDSGKRPIGKRRSLIL